MRNVLLVKLTIDWRILLSLVCALVDVCLATPRPHLEGHLLPLDQQGYRLGDIDAVDGFLDPVTFYNQYAKSGKPVLFRGAAMAIPAYSKWTDEYLKQQYGRLAVDVEIGKKETRQQEVERMPLEQLINAYSSEDIYMVQDVVNAMKGELSVPRCLQCGGFQDVLEAAVIWFSSGGTKSVLHYDEVDNINCLFDGEKSLVMIDKAYFDEVESEDSFVYEGGYSKVDVEKVDLEAFPQFSGLSWWAADMKQGDCLFIPYRWYHTVSSSPGRNLAVNVWFVHRLWFNASDCDRLGLGALEEAAPMDRYSVAGLDNPHSAEKIRSEVFGMFEGKESISQEDALELWDFPQDPQLAQEAFKQVDSNVDLKLDWVEVYAADVQSLVQQYPFVLAGLLDELAEDEEKEEL